MTLAREVDERRVDRDAVGAPDAGSELDERTARAGRLVHGAVAVGVEIDVRGVDREVKRLGPGGHPRPEAEALGAGRLPAVVSTRAAVLGVGDGVGADASAEYEGAGCARVACVRGRKRADSPRGTPDRCDTSSPGRSSLRLRLRTAAGRRSRPNRGVLPGVVLRPARRLAARCDAGEPDPRRPYERLTLARHASPPGARERRKDASEERDRGGPDGEHAPPHGQSGEDPGRIPTAMATFARSRASRARQRALAASRTSSEARLTVHSPGVEPAAPRATETSAAKSRVVGRGCVPMTATTCPPRPAAAPRLPQSARQDLGTNVVDVERAADGLARLARLAAQEDRLEFAVEQALHGRARARPEAVLDEPGGR